MGLFSKFPVARSMAAYSLLYPGANVFQQLTVRKEERVDWAEATRFLVYGGICHAPIVHGWLKFVAYTIPGTSMKQVAKKVRCTHTSGVIMSFSDLSFVSQVVFDQTCFAPFALTSFYCGLSALEFVSLEEIYKEWRAKFPGTWAVRLSQTGRNSRCINVFSLQTSVFIWPFLQGFNFRYVPAAQRPIFVGCMSFFWTTALAYWKHEKVPMASGAV